MADWTRLGIGTLAAAGILAASVARADDIGLKNGDKYSGSLIRQGDSMVIKTDDGKTITVKPSDIANVNLTDSVSPAEAANSEWTRITQEIKTADDLQLIIQLHQGFLKKYADSPLAKDVRTSLEVYQKLSENDGVKFRGRWIPRAQVEVVVKEWAEAAKPAVDLYKDGKMKEALAEAKTVLAADGQNPDALTVAGLAAFKSDNMPQARTYFTSLASADPTSLLAENNLAVIASVQKQPAEGLGHYTKALAIKPDNRLLLDNIEEAINSYLAGKGDKNATNLKVLQRAFDQAEKSMETKMAQKENGGLQRYGASWATADQMSHLADYQKSARAEAAQLESQYQAARIALGGIESQITQAQADQQAETNNVIALSEQLGGNTPAAAENNAAWAAARDAAVQNLDRTQRYLAELQSEHTQFLASTKDYFAQADRVRATLSAGFAGLGSGYTGTQRIMDLGEDQKSPPPPSISDPPPLPPIPALPPLVMAPAPVQAPPITTVVTPVFVPVQGRPGR